MLGRFPFVKPGIGVRDKNLMLPKSMRPYIFRAWDNKFKEMIVEDFAVIGETTMFGIIEEWISEHKEPNESTLERLGDVVISQYTGLNDKNDKMIYEGDKVRVMTRAKEGKAYIGIIVWNVDQFMILFKSEDEFPYVSGLGAWNHECEVIGNIFQNE
jgi:uncharacterized phage protein (TIGR01671 family)